ncbi:MAG: phenylacetate--CoA ligase, partial [Phyllobacteriaceae bacterium]|nr:phenylacetate--CoA ligase [Phyllobacteriaceae bacterium]
MSIAALDAAMAARLGLPAEASRDDFARARLARLAATLAAARTESPFYRARRDWPERPPESLADLARYPFTTPEDLVRADPPLAAVSGGAVERIVTLPTSGTTGA